MSADDITRAEREAAARARLDDPEFVRRLDRAAAELARTGAHSVTIDGEVFVALSYAERRPRGTTTPSEPS